MISNFKLFPYLNISQNFVQNVQKQKKHLCPELYQASIVLKSTYSVVSDLGQESTPEFP